MYIESVEITRDYRTFHHGEVFDLGPQCPSPNLVLLVGEQGCGKSTLLQGLFGLSKNKESVTAIASHRDPFLKINLTPLGDKGVAFYYFDTESMNPRMRNPEEYTKVDGSQIGIGMANALASRWKSHGEVLRAFTVDGVSRMSKCVTLMDEPESGLSLKNQYRLAEHLRVVAMEKGCQIIMATHCLPLIESVHAVLSLEHKSWVESSWFIRESKTPSH